MARKCVFLLAENCAVYFTIHIKKDGYEPIYTRTDFTDTLHEEFGFRTDYEIVTLKQMKNIFKVTKRQ